MSAAAAAFALVVSNAFPSTVLAQGPAEVSNPQIEIEYVQPRNPAYRPIYDRLKQRQVLEELQRFLTPLRLPAKLVIKVDQCGAPTVPFRPGGPAVICYELVEQIESIAAKADANNRATVLIGTFVQATLHEVAHAIFDIYKVPVWGREGDAADRLAGFLMLQFGEDLARQAIVGTAIFFELSGKTWSGSAFADTNSPEAQRYYNYLCVAYGGRPATFQFLVKTDDKSPPILPEARAKRCPGEYEQVRKAFNLRIMPYVDPDMLVKSRAARWVLPGTGR
jgi:hypothetical protein